MTDLGDYIPIKIYLERYIVSDSGCWNYTGYKDKQGYGVFSQGYNNMKKAHRESYIFHIGPIPEGLLVCHKCDNPSCVNPEHLFIGTTQDNVDDKMRKGRLRPVLGSKNNMAKINEDDVRKIREMILKGMDNHEISAMFNVTASNIYYIRRGKTWKHVT